MMGSLSVSSIGSEAHFFADVIAPAESPGMTDAPIIAKGLRGVDDIQRALRARALDLKIVFDARTRNLAEGEGRIPSLDNVVGLPEGYAAKLLAPVPLKSFGRTSLGPMLTALGCELWLVVDHVAVAKYTARIERNPHRNGSASGRMLPTKRKRRYPKLGPEWSRIMNARRYLLVPEGKRKSIARTAANARWGKPLDQPKKSTLLHRGRLMETA
jgi:hypothetical protein